MKNKKVLRFILIFGILLKMQGSGLAQSGNFVRTWVATAAETNPNTLMSLPLNNVREKTEYLDGLGRPMQLVDKDGSLVNSVKKDIVVPIEYDEAGRQVKSYLPYTSSVSPGQFKVNAVSAQQQFITTLFSEAPSYGLTEYDNSPLNRITKTMLPGTSWAGSNAGISYDYDVNLNSEKVHIWTIGYTAGVAPSTSPTAVYTDAQLFKYVTTDENLKQVITYTDKSGNLILKKVQDKTGSALTVEHAGWLCTYYVYDDFGQQRFIIPPKAVVYLDTHNWALSSDVINELCFSNEYDERGRLIVKKSPGADPVYFVYDQRDRLVFSQDGNQRNQTPKKWMATLYDNLDRVTTTGLIDYASTRAALQLSVNNITNNASNGVVVVNSSIPPQANLVVDSRTGNTPALYSATNSITFADGFVSGATDNFVAQIDGTVQSSNSNVPVNGNPLPSGNNLYTLTLIFYDDYSYAGSKTFSNNFTIDNSVPANETESVQKTSQTIDFLTGTKVRLLDGGNTFLTTTSFYDYRGRLIQLQGDNHKGYTNENTTQYDFSGKVRSTYEYHRFDGNSDIKIYTHNTYDLLGRIIKIGKSINGAAEKDIASYTYNELGQLANKKLAPGFAGEDGPQLESLDYTYNIQGWLLGINKAYAASTTRTGNYFGMELGYDKAGTPNFTSSQKNGNIAGNAWKTRGDNTIRKYDYNYDNANQLLSAAFNQRNTPGAGWTKDKMDFTSNYGYDENGNIKTQNQSGIVPGLAPLQIDQQIYHYDLVVPGGWTNKLSNIDERVVLFSNGNLGDFKNGSAGAVTQQYWYDKNANLSRDLNKEIGNASVDGTQYNFMNLPTLITFKNTNKTIAFIYDAAGNKLRKILDEPANGANSARHIETDYEEEFVYETSPVNLGGTGVPVLQFFGHEEGRIRRLNDGSFVYDYFIKDHLSNVRMILTEEQKQDIYPAATLETSKLTTEQLYYDISTGQITDKSILPAIPNYQNNNGIANPPSNATFDNANSSKLYVLNKNSQKTGLGIALEVMSGDKIDIFGKSYYIQNNPSPGGNSQLLASDIINALLASPTGAATGKGDVTNILSNANITTPLNSFLSNHNPFNANKPKAFINYILLDEQFNFVTGGLSAIDDNPYILKDHHPELQNILMPANGYLYIYCSNESPVDVFFDNVQVVHTRGRVLEENHYYSYGLKIAGISSKAPGSLQNKYLYQGDFSENDQETALDEFDLRHYDPQVGRWTTTDPYEQFASPYLGMGNSPNNFIDPYGGSLDDWIGYITKAGVKTVQWFDENFNEAKQIIESLGGGNVEDLGLSGFWQSTENGIQNWLLNADGSSTLLDGLFTGTAPTRALEILKEIPATKLGFFQSLNIVNDNLLHNIGISLFTGIANDAYITKRNYAQGHTGFIRDLNGDLVGSKERLSAGVNTFQLFMASSDFALPGIKTAGEQAVKSIGEGRSAVKSWLQSAGNLERGQLIQDIEGAGFKRVGLDNPVGMHFERGGMKIRLDPSQAGTPFNHMHLELGRKANRTFYDMLLNSVPYDAPAAHIPIR